MRWVAKAPSSWFTSDGNTGHMGVFCSFTLVFFRVRLKCAHAQQVVFPNFCTSAGGVCGVDYVTANK